MDTCTYHCEAWPECRCAPKEPMPLELDPLEKIIDAYIDDYVFEADEGSHSPGEFERVVIKDAIMGLLVDKDWDEHWGRLIAEQAAKLHAQIKAASVRIYTASNTARTYPAIQVVIADLHLQCDLVDDRQISLAKRLADDHGVLLEVAPEFQARVSKALSPN